MIGINTVDLLHATELDGDRLKFKRAKTGRIYNIKVEPEAMAIYEQRRLAFKARRDFLLPAFAELGLHVPVKPDGAFYIYADVSQHSNNSNAFSQRLLHEAGVAAVPGLDFGPAYANKMLRFSYATSLDRLEEAIERMRKFLG